MFEWLAQQNPRELIGLVAVVGGILFLVITVVSAQWGSVRRAEMRAHQAEQELALKQQMIERGMSADEIAKVLASGAGIDGKHARCKSKWADESVKV